MKRFFLFWTLFVMLVAPLNAQETITVMQYNLLEYGNYQSGFAECYETNNNTQRKDECIRTLMDYVKPDILTVCEFGATQALLNDFMRHNLNTNANIDYWKSDNIINYAHSNIINHIFYDSRKMELKKHVALRTKPRDTDIYELYMKTPGLVSGDTVKLVCIVAHPKAGMGYHAERRALMQTAMDYVNLHYGNDNVLIMGDFNMYSSSETGYQLLTRTYSNPDILFVDPLAGQGVGNWNSNAQFAQYHTQSTRRYSEECFSSGGLDDRFDFILMSDEIYMGFNRIRYVNNTYHAVGNDGFHFDQSVNQNYNAAVPAEVAEALYDASDHLPVTMKMTLYSQWDVEEHADKGLSVFPNPASGRLTVSINGDYRIANVMGQLLMTGTVNDGDIDVSGLPAGIYFLSINGVTQKFVKQ